MYFTIETDRLKIRPIGILDAGFMLELVNSEGWLKFIGNRNISSEEQAQIYVDGILNTKDFYYSIFELKKEGTPIGIVSFIKRVDEKLPDLGFAILPQFERNGYAYEASQGYIQELQRSEVFDEILAIAKPENSSSLHLIEKLGFTLEKEEFKNGQVLKYYSMNLNNPISNNAG